jgi:hypothetical protein
MINTVLLLLSTLLAQPEYYVFDYGTFIEGNTVHIFGDKVNIREEPSVTSNIIETLPIGYPVYIVEKTDERYDINGYIAPWYQVSFTYENEDKEGYLWGGLLSIVSLDTDDDKMFLYGITGYNDEGDEYISEARIAEDGKILSQTEFTLISGYQEQKGIYDYSVSGTVFDHSGFTTVKNIFNVSFIYEACGFVNGEALIFWDGKDITFGLLTERVSEAGCYRTEADVFFPAEITGNPDYLIVLYTFIEYGGEETGNYIEKSVELYHWNKKQLKKVEATGP